MDTEETSSDENASGTHLDVLRTVLSKWRQRFEGCSFIGRKERSRSRRKGEKVSKKQHRMASASAGNACSQESNSAEPCVCDNISSQMIEKFTTLPTGIDSREWLAVHTFALFDHINALCGNISELCTPVTCPNMNYPGNSKAAYVDEKGKRYVYSAMQYVDAAMSYCEKISRNEEVFPTKYASTFAGDFNATIRRMVRMLWHCLGHLYVNHWDILGQLDLRPQCLLVTAHMGQLSKIFNLLEPEDQAALDDIITKKRSIRTHRPGPESEGKDFQTPSVSNSSDHFAASLSKSRSWGGHSSSSITVSVNASRSPSQKAISDKANTMTF